MVGACSGNEHKADQHLAINEKYPINSLKEDYDQLMRVIKKNHPALYDYTKKDEYESLIKFQYNKIRDSLTITDFYNILSPVVTQIGCGHSGVHLPDWIWKDSSVVLLPLDLFFQNKRGYIIENYSSDKRLKAGTEILSINGEDIPSLLQGIEKGISTDGDNISAKKDIINQSFSTLLASYHGFPREYEINTRFGDEDSVRIVISSMQAQSYFERRAKFDSPLDIEIDSARDAAIVTIKSFGFYDKLEEFKSFVDNAFDQIQRASIDHVILDLRNNSGGDPFCGSYLLTYLTKTPVVYYSEPYPPYEALAKPLPPCTNHFSGKLYVLTNGICFSTTGHLCALLKYHEVGEFIGTETGGTYTCNDNSQTFRLINTGLLARIARGTFSVAVDGLPRFKGIIPDYMVEQSLQDVLSDKDQVKEFAMRRIAESVKVSATR